MEGNGKAHERRNASSNGDDWGRRYCERGAFIVLWYVHILGHSADGRVADNVPRNLDVHDPLRVRGRGLRRRACFIV